MVQSGEGAGLPVETGEPCWILGEGLGQDLDGDLAAQAWITSPVDLAHTPGSQRSQDLVGAELRAC